MNRFSGDRKQKNVHSTPFESQKTCPRKKQNEGFQVFGGCGGVEG